jgi:broad specificity phosphatase PhoE
VTRLYLVRHGRAEAGWDTAIDPGLDATGQRQAADVAQRLAQLGQVTVLTSPLRRCRETAAALTDLSGVEAVIEPGVAEIPSPKGVAMGERTEWLRLAMRGSWNDLGARYVDFRDRVVATLSALHRDTVVFSHFIAINTAIGAALADDRLVIRSLDNCSVTILDVADGGLQLVEAGHEADTLIR